MMYSVEEIEAYTREFEAKYPVSGKINREFREWAADPTRINGSSGDSNAAKAWLEEYESQLAAAEQAELKQEREGMAADAKEGAAKGARGGGVLSQDEWNNAVECEVTDARTAASDLHTHGFTLVPHVTAVKDFTDEAEVKATYYDELIQLVSGLTGSKHVFLENHVIREDAGEFPSSAVQQPVQLVHNDFTEGYKKELLESFRGNNSTITFNTWDNIASSCDLSLEELEASRVMMINAWRNTKDTPISRFPLAVCDMSSITLDDTINARLGENSLEICLSSFNPQHSWNYFPDMTKDEVLLIKTYDSAVVPFVPPFHSSFDDGSGSGGASRRSCEARLLVVLPYEEDQEKKDAAIHEQAKL